MRETKGLLTSPVDNIRRVQIPSPPCVAIFKAQQMGSGFAKRQKEEAGRETRPVRFPCKGNKCSPLSGLQAACPEKPPATRARASDQPGLGKEPHRGGCSLGGCQDSLKHNCLPPHWGPPVPASSLFHPQSSHSGLAFDDTGFCGRSKKMNSKYSPQLRQASWRRLSSAGLSSGSIMGLSTVPTPGCCCVKRMRECT